MISPTLSDAEIDRYAQVIWGYMQLHHTLRPCDIVLACGSSDLRVAERAARLFLDGYGDHLVTSGGFGRFTKDMFHRPEGEIFANIAVEMGVPRERIIIESKANSTGQNITLTYDLLKQRGLLPKSALLVCRTGMERRTYATFMKQWPESGASILVTSPQLSFEQYPTLEFSREHLINLMVGDLQRIKEYPAKGFQIEQSIPTEVWDAYEHLVNAGFDTQLIR